MRIFFIFFLIYKKKHSKKVFGDGAKGQGMQHKISIVFFVMMLGVSTPALSLNLKTTEGSTNESSVFSPNVATLADIVSEQPNEAFIDIDDTINLSSNITDSLNMSDYYEFEDSSDNTNNDAKDVSTNITKDTETKKVNKHSVSKKSNIAKPSRKSTIAKATKKSNDKFSDILVGEGEEVLVSSSIPANNTLENLYSVTPKIENETITNTVAQTTPVPSINEVATQENEVSQNVSSTTDNQSSFSDSSSQNNPFGVMVSKSAPKKIRSVNHAKYVSQNKPNMNKIGNANPFIRAFSALRPEKMTSAKIRKATSNMAKNAPKRREQTISSLSSDALKRDLNRAYLSDNQYLSPVEGIDDETDTEYVEDEMAEGVDEEFEENAEERAEEMGDDINYSYQQNVGEALEGTGPANINKITNTTPSQLSSSAIKNKIKDVKNSKLAPSGPLKAGSREVLQMKIDFQDGSSAVSGESVNLIRSFAQVATDQPTNSIEITIPQSVMNNPTKKKLTARRLSIVSNILRNAGISERQIKPILTDRDENSFAFRIISNDEFKRLRISKGNDIFGEDENIKEYNIMKW